MEDLDAIAPSCLSETWPKARKAHKCCECGRTIQPGEKYMCISGIWDGRPSRFKTCTECANLGARFRCHVEYEYNPSFCCLFEYMDEEGVTKEDLLSIVLPMERDRSG